jgi:prolyl 4-hydroxylase
MPPFSFKDGARRKRSRSMKKEIPPDWLDWIQLNISRNCDKDGIAKILLDNHFDPAAIVSAMRYLPTNPDLIGEMNRKLAAPVPVQEAELLPMFRDIDSVYLPLAAKLNTDKVHFYIVEDFLSAQECDELVRRIRAQNQASTTTNPDEPDKYFRTSKTSNLSEDNDPFVKEINRRVADYLGFEPERSEGMQGQYYQVGEQFKAHTDYFEPNTDEFRKFAGQQGQRTWTFMIYLNDVEEGGQTEFTRLGVAVSPKKGTAVVWNSLRADGSVNPDTEHWAKPVVKGEKFIITKWFRTHGSLTKPYKQAAWRKIPAFTREGFVKTRMPADLMHDVSAFYAAQRPVSVPEQSDAIGTYIRTPDKRQPSRMIELDATLRARVSIALHPLLESWVRKPLKMTAVYGIREYQNGAILDMHIDRMETHIVSAILNIAQEVTTDWPLVIHDHFGRRHSVLLQPGEMLFYESARLKHGRPQPLDGARFANVFVHSMPE